ncbi:Sulfite exporter TauE/SafE family protein 3 [Cucurbita argyrosperma subsp. argyrosperma]|uniref:Sulfite exporter TauE/SafE family protein 3 n=2 Tax=Cucurbita TaxID=3660 RepID=A0A6J1FC89_CUCMO
MAREFGGICAGFRSMAMTMFNFAIALAMVSGERKMKLETARLDGEGGSDGLNLIRGALNFLWQSDRTGYHHVWPEMEFGWQIVLGSVIGFLGAAFGSVGGVGGGGIYVPMLSLIIGFDPKSSTAISKCMIMGASVSTVYYNLKLRHPTLDLPIIDYDLVLLIMPMLMLGISIGVVFNVIFADWMVTVLLIVLFLATSTKSFLKGVETWKKETIMKTEAARRAESNDLQANTAYAPLPSGPSHRPETDPADREVPMLKNVYWKEMGLLVLVWVAFLAIQIIKKHSPNCSWEYWLLNLLQIPIAFGASGYEAVSLYKGRRKIASLGNEKTNFQVYQLVLYCFLGIVAGVVGGLLGLGGGFIMGPLFLELGIPPQVSSASATFGMTFSSSMSVIEYYLLDRFPVPYAVYFTIVAAIAAFVGQHVIRKLINLIGRASLIIFILSFTIFVSAISLGGVGISKTIGQIQRHEYMGFENLCKYDA